VVVDVDCLVVHTKGEFLATVFSTAICGFVNELEGILHDVFVVF
jgi:hypothetical protein